MDDVDNMLSHKKKESDRLPTIRVGSRVKVVGGAYGVGMCGVMKYRQDSVHGSPGGYFEMEHGWTVTIGDRTGLVWFPLCDLEPVTN